MAKGHKPFSPGQDCKTVHFCSTRGPKQGSNARKRSKMTAYWNEKVKERILPIPSVDEDMEQPRMFAHSLGKCNMTQSLPKAAWQFLKKFTNTTYDLYFPLLSIYPKETETSTHTKNSRSCFIYQSPKVTTQMAIYRRMDKQIVHIYTTEYY